MKYMTFVLTSVITLFVGASAFADSYYDYKNGKRYYCQPDEDRDVPRGSACFCKDLGYGVYRYELRKVEGSIDSLIRMYDNERNCQIAVSSDRECFN